MNVCFWCPGASSQCQGEAASPVWRLRGGLCLCVCVRRGGRREGVVSRGYGIPSENKVRCVWWKTGANVDELERRHGCNEAGAKTHPRCGVMVRFNQSHIHDLLWCV